MNTTRHGLDVSPFTQTFYRDSWKNNSGMLNISEGINQTKKFIIIIIFFLHLRFFSFAIKLLGLNPWHLILINAPHCVPNPKTYISGNVEQSVLLSILVSRILKT